MQLTDCKVREAQFQFYKTYSANNYISEHWNDLPWKKPLNNGAVCTCINLCIPVYTGSQPIEFVSSYCHLGRVNNDRLTDIIEQ